MSTNETETNQEQLSTEQETKDEPEEKKGMIERITDISIQGTAIVGNYALDKWSTVKENERVGPYAQKAEDLAQGAFQSVVGVSKSVLDRGKKVTELVGSQYQHLRSQIEAHVNEGSVFVWTTVEKATSIIKHVISGPNALEVIANQEAFITMLQRQQGIHLTIPARSEHIEIKFIPRGSSLCWEFIVENYDIGFAVYQNELDANQRTQRHEVIAQEIYEAGEKIQGKWEASEDSTVVLIWDNTYSTLRKKDLAVRIWIGEI